MKNTTVNDYIKSYKEKGFRVGMNVEVIPRKRWTKRDIYYLTETTNIGMPSYEKYIFSIVRFDENDGSVKLSNSAWYLPTMLKRP